MAGQLSLLDKEERDKGEKKKGRERERERERAQQERQGEERWRRRKKVSGSAESIKYERVLGLLRKFRIIFGCIVVRHFMDTYVIQKAIMQTKIDSKDL